MRRPPRLQKRGHRFYCRTSVPHDLRPAIGKAEIVRALKTADYAEALERLPLASAEVNAELAEARRKSGVKPVTSLSDHDTKQLVLRWLWNRERALAETEATSDGETWLPRAEAISENRSDLAQLLDPEFHRWIGRADQHNRPVRVKLRNSADKIEVEPARDHAVVPDNRSHQRHSVWLHFDW